MVRQKVTNECILWCAAGAKGLQEFLTRRSIRLVVLVYSCLVACFSRFASGAILVIVFFRVCDSFFKGMYCDSVSWVCILWEFL
jgi:hypothetical protein